MSDLVLMCAAGALVAMSLDRFDVASVLCLHAAIISGVKCWFLFRRKRT
jgi:hypothetical protein